MLNITLFIRCKIARHADICTSRKTVSETRHQPSQFIVLRVHLKEIVRYWLLVKTVL